MTQIFTRIIALFADRQDSERGATMVEYGLMLALIAVVCIGVVGLIGTNASNMFTTIAGAL